MQPLFEYQAEFNGVRTRVLELEGEGTPLVLVHGWADSADTWRHTLAALGRVGRAAIAIDLPGFGKAQALADGPMLPQYDDFLQGVAKSVGPGAVFVGNSLGGCASLRLAERNRRLGGVVAVAPAGLDMARWFSIVDRDPALRRILSLPLPMPSGALRAVVGRTYQTLAFAKPETVDPAVIRDFTSHIPSRTAVARLLKNGKRLLPELKDPFDLSKINTRVLLVWGTADRMVYRTGADRVLETVPNSRLEILEGCGHCPQIEEPSKFADMILDFAAVEPALRAA
ncbi:MAG: alpha/beta hydrolase [Actinomycetes bacterium]